MIVLSACMASWAALSLAIVVAYLVGSAIC